MFQNCLNNTKILSWELLLGYVAFLSTFLIVRILCTCVNGRRFLPFANQCEFGSDDHYGLNFLRISGFILYFRELGGCSELKLDAIYLYKGYPKIEREMVCLFVIYFWWISIIQDSFINKWKKEVHWIRLSSSCFALKEKKNWFAESWLFVFIDCCSVAGDWWMSC